MTAQKDIFSKLTQHTVWDFIITRGIVCLIIGVLFITMPMAVIDMLCLLLGIFLLINGLGALIKAMKTKDNKNILLAYGLFCLGAGIIILIKPEFLAGLIVMVFALLVLVSGLNQIIAGIKAKGTPGSARILATVTGLLSIALGLALLIRPDAGAQVMIMLIGIYFMAFGILAIATGAVIRKAGKSGHTIVG